MVTVEPTRESSAVVLKKAAIDVIVPSRGTEKAKFVTLVRSIVGPSTVMPTPELPNPTKAGMPTNPPVTDVIVIGAPDA